MHPYVRWRRGSCKCVLHLLLLLRLLLLLLLLLPSSCRIGGSSRNSRSWDSFLCLGTRHHLGERYLQIFHALVCYLHFSKSGIVGTVVRLSRRGCDCTL